MEGIPAAVLEVPGRDFACKVAKADATSDLTVEVTRAGRVVNRTHARLAPMPFASGAAAERGRERHSGAPTLVRPPGSAKIEPRGPKWMSLSSPRARGVARAHRAHTRNDAFDVCESLRNLPVRLPDRRRGVSLGAGGCGHHLMAFRERQDPRQLGRPDGELPWHTTASLWTQAALRIPG